jgi:hypothetical protein
MAQEIREYVVMVPAGTAKATPQVTSVSFPERIVTAISWRVPPGPAGLMGWALTSAGTPVIPIQPGTYMVTDNQADTWPLEGYLDSGNWQVTAYNTGVYPHSIYLTFLLDLPGSPATPPASGTGAGGGIVGTTGTVVPPPSPPPSPSQPPAPPVDDSVTVISTVLAALMSQLVPGA